MGMPSTSAAVRCTSPRRMNGAATTRSEATRPNTYASPVRSATSHPTSAVQKCAVVRRQPMPRASTIETRSVTSARSAKVIVKARPKRNARYGTNRIAPMTTAITMPGTPPARGRTTGTTHASVPARKATTATARMASMPANARTPVDRTPSNVASRPRSAFDDAAMRAARQMVFTTMSPIQRRTSPTTAMASMSRRGSRWSRSGDPLSWAQLRTFSPLTDAKKPRTHRTLCFHAKRSERETMFQWSIRRGSFTVPSLSLHVALLEYRDGRGGVSIERAPCAGR